SLPGPVSKRRPQTLPDCFRCQLLSAYLRRFITLRLWLEERFQQGRALTLLTFVGGRRERRTPPALCGDAGPAGGEGASGEERAFFDSGGARRAQECLQRPVDRDGRAVCAFGAPDDFADALPHPTTPRIF